MKMIEHHLQKHDLIKADLCNKKLPDKEQRRFEILERKQNRLLMLSVTILLNLAEDIKIERKMKRRGIVKSLVKLLYRDNLSLLEVVLSFLKKVSIFSEIKNELIDQENILEALQRFIPCPHHSSLCSNVLTLVYNLSFDSTFRVQLDSYGFIPRIVSLIKETDFRGITIRILYQLSLEERFKSTVTYTECLPMVYMMLTKFPERKIGKELMALAINLCTNPRNAEIISEGEQLKNLINRALECEDELILKMIRNISSSGKSTQIQESLAKYASKFIKLICSSEAIEFTIELLGILVHLDAEIVWNKLLPNSPILEYIQKHLVVGYSEDDVLLECVMLTGTLTCSESTSSLIANTPIVKLLDSLLSEKQEDDEIVMQIIHTYHKMLHFVPTRKLILQETRVINYLLELLQDNNPRIKQLADSVLALIQDCDDSYREEIKSHRFSLYNQEWITSIQQSKVQENWELNSSEDPNQLHWADLSDIGDNQWGDMSYEYN